MKSRLYRRNYEIGRQLGAREILTYGLEAKFSAEDLRPYRGQLQEADADTLSRWCRYVLHAETVADVFRE